MTQTCAPSHKNTGELFFFFCSLSTCHRRTFIRTILQKSTNFVLKWSIWPVYLEGGQWLFFFFCHALYEKQWFFCGNTWRSLILHSHVFIWIRSTLNLILSKDSTYPPQKHIFSHGTSLAFFLIFPDFFLIPCTKSFFFFSGDYDRHNNVRRRGHIDATHIFFFFQETPTYPPQKL